MCTSVVCCDTYLMPYYDLCNSSQVSYNLVVAYETTAGMKSFAELDSFNITGTVFHFAILSSVTLKVCVMLVHGTQLVYVLVTLTH